MARTNAIRHTKPQPPKYLPISLDEYSDASSTYWPSNWSFSRFVRCDPDDIATLSDDEADKMRAGLREALGEAGMDNLVALMYKAEGGDVEPMPASQPTWLRTVEKRFADQVWGFVGYRTCCYSGEETSRWDEYKSKIGAAIRLPFVRDASIPGVAAAAARFEIRWIEDPQLAHANLNMLQRHFSELLPSLPNGFSSTMFLTTTPYTVDDVLECVTHGPTARRWRQDAPYILAVAAADQRPANIDDPADEDFDDERAGFKEIFRVAAETLIDELWELVVGMEWPIWRITGLTEGVKLEGGELVDGHDEAVSAVDNAQTRGPVLDMIWWSWMPNPYIPEPRRSRRRAGQ